MRITNYSCFSYFRMCNKGTFNFSCTKVMSRYYYYIIYSSSYPIVTVLISFTSVSSKVFSIKLRKICIYKPFMITVNSFSFARARKRLDIIFLYKRLLKFFPFRQLLQVLFHKRVLLQNPA